MSRRKVAPLLFAASVFLTGATGILVGAMAPAHAITSVEELRDVDTSSWAYQALADLVEKYDVIEGYPDHTFRGNRNATRYEMAAALNALVKSVGRDLARLGAEKANKSDLATLARLQEEFRNELAALNAKEAALEARASAIEAKNADQDKRLDLLEKTQLHGDVSLGVLADWTGSGNRTSPDVIGVNPGIQDSVSTLGRFRLGVKVPVVPGYDNSSVGEGDIIARLVGAFGRWTPAGVNNAAIQNPFPISGYSAIAGNASLFNEGIRSDSLSLGGLATGGGGVGGGLTTGINLRQNLYVESAYYKQHFKPGIPVLTELPFFPDNDKFRTTADLYAGIVPWRNLFNRSPYRGDELNQFQNTALVNNAGLLVNNVSPTFALAWHQGLGEHFSADLTGAVATMDVSDFMNGFNVSEELNFNYDTAFLGPNWTKPGSLYVGGYHIFFDGNTNLANITAGAAALADRNSTALVFPGSSANGTINALYVGWNQEWWRGIGTSVDWSLPQSTGTNTLVNALRNGTGTNAALQTSLATGGTTVANVVGIQSALSATLTVPMTAFNKNLTNRAKDVWGLGYSWINPTDPTVPVTYNNGDEHVFETYYRWAINDSMSVVPSFQAIVNRGGVTQNGVAWVLGLRTNYVF